MAEMDVALKDAMQIDGAIGVALVDHSSGMALGTVGGGKDLDLTVAAAGNTDVVRAKLRAMEMLNISEKLEDILITLGSQYHLIRPLTSRSGKGLFLYLALNRDRANLAMARHRLRVIEQTLDASNTGFGASRRSPGAGQVFLDPVVRRVDPRLQLGQQPVAVGQDLAENAAPGGEQVQHRGRAEGVHDRAAVPERDHDAGPTQDGQLLRHA
jgi:hypothetical protein